MEDDAIANSRKSRPRGARAFAAWWRGLDSISKGVLSLGAFAGVVVGVTRSCDRVVSAAQLESLTEAQAAIDAQQDEDLDLLFQTQVRLVTSVENLQHEVREVRKDLRAIDSGRPLPPLRTPEPASATKGKP